jgi:hypothetical protein
MSKIISHKFHVLKSVLRNLGQLELRDHFLSLEVLDSHQKAIQDIERVRDNASTHARVRIVFCDNDLQVKIDAPSKTRSDRDGIFSESNRVQANNECRIIEQLFVLLQVVNKIEDFTLLAAFNRDYNFWVRFAQSLARFDRSNGGK